MEIPSHTPPRQAIDTPSKTSSDMKVAQEFEAVFLSEMLKYSGVNKTSESFGGGAGEEAFVSMLNDEYAKALTRSGGIGIAEIIYQSIQARKQNTEGT